MNDTAGNEMIKFDGLDDAIAGIGTVWEGNSRRDLFVYSGERIIEILMDEHDMNGQEALEYLSFNMESLYAGPGTPIIMWALTLGEKSDYGLNQHD